MTCGPGTHTRTRSCDNPAPEHGGDDCGELTEETDPCEITPCPGKSVTETNTVNTRHSPIVGSMLGQRGRLWVQH